MAKFFGTFLVILAAICATCCSYKIYNSEAEEFPDEYYEQSEDDYLSTKFRPDEFTEILEDLHKSKQESDIEIDGDSWWNLKKRPPHHKFAEITPDIVLERLIDEADDEEVNGEDEDVLDDEDGDHDGDKDEEKMVIVQQPSVNMHQHHPGIDDDLDDTL
eukprot:gene483-1128_t